MKLENEHVAMQVGGNTPAIQHGVCPINFSYSAPLDFDKFIWAIYKIGMNSIQFNYP